MTLGSDDAEFCNTYQPVNCKHYKALYQCLHPAAPRRWFCLPPKCVLDPMRDYKDPRPTLGCRLQAPYQRGVKAPGED